MFKYRKRLNADEELTEKERRRTSLRRNALGMEGGILPTVNKTEKMLIDVPQRG